MATSKQVDRFTDGYIPVHTDIRYEYDTSCCECCNESLGGPRYEFVGIIPGEHGNIELGIVCEECFFQLIGI